MLPFTMILDEKPSKILEDEIHAEEPVDEAPTDDVVEDTTPVHEAEEVLEEVSEMR